ncbi:MAG: L-2-hydroxyglutarate oxidase [Dehalococcoidia bacterium]|nr:L-2-hydroxyglutarate oxidase [Dehalococcoidia bacterium]MQG15328.1 L-2-hydroxyglutarate oxidase [SAR202 cluster bacterium]|tara:strand:- start:18424 stop:19635 length:1212 start_codon:yes stop_codon:yes gene_type:complete
MNKSNYDIAVIGAGIIGLATAMQLTIKFPLLKIAVLDKETVTAEHQTGHNSGVIHAGIYYKPGSAKASFCYTGNQELRKFCDENSVPYKMCGKLVIAVNKHEIPMLEELHKRGTANGVEGLQIIGKDELREKEPNAAGLKAIWSPNTGIIDYKKVTESYADIFTKNEGDLHLNSKVKAITRENKMVVLETENKTIKSKYVINCAGLHADQIAKLMGHDSGIRIVPFRGEYYSIDKDRKNMINGLIYPVPDPSMPFLGVHFTTRIDGTVEAGPNAVLAFAREGYSKFAFNLKDAFNTVSFPGFWKMSAKHWKTGFEEQYRSINKNSFLKSLQYLVPDIKMSDLTEPGSGVRAQAVDMAGNLLQDFSIIEADKAIHVLSAPSPGATSSLTIGRHIVDLAQKNFEL